MIRSFFSDQVCNFFKPVQANKSPTKSPVQSLPLDLQQKSTLSVSCKNVVLMWHNFGDQFLLWLNNDLLFRSHSCMRSTSDLYPKSIWQANVTKVFSRKSSWWIIQNLHDHFLTECESFSSDGTWLALMIAYKYCIVFSEFILVT